MTERFDYTISLSKPARRRKYKVQTPSFVAAFSALETEGKMYYNLIEIYNREVFDEHTRNA